MHFETHKQFFTNEAILASLGQPSVYRDPGDVPDPRCERCNKKLTDDDPEDSIYCEECYQEYCIDMGDYVNDNLLDK